MTTDSIDLNNNNNNNNNDINNNDTNNNDINNNTSSSWNIIKNPSNGRTRISQACDRCRARKIKCSGKSENNPKCTNCEKDGFPCTVSDKLTRNSFPKGYTKNLEKKLLDVELNRNNLLLELNNLKKKLQIYESNNNNNNDNNDDNNNHIDINNESFENNINDDKDKDIKDNDENNFFLTNNRIENYYFNPIKINKSGLLILDQNLKSPFESFFTSLKKNPFKGFKSTNFNNQLSNIDDILDSNSLKYLSNYHMNLNRYLNLILYKLIFPLFNSNNNNNNNNSKNLDHLIWLFFNDYNKLIPIFDFELFYNDYLNFINTYTIKNSTYSDNGELKKRYYEFNTKDQDILIKLILILKFTLCQPKINISNKSSAFLPDKNSLNQLDESIKLINLKHLILMFKNINFTFSPNLDKLEISLLLFYYLIKFENYNLQNYTDNLHSHKDFLLNVIDLNKFLINTLNINKPNNLLITEKFPEKQLIEIQRLKLYWNFRILIKLSETYFNIPLIDNDYINNESNNNDNDNNNNNNNKPVPKSLDSIILVNNDIKITLCLVELLNLIPWNIMQLVNDDNKEILNNLNSNLSNWRNKVENLYDEDNSIVFNKLKSYYLYFKVLININNKIDSFYYIEFINLVYDLTFNNNNKKLKIKSNNNNNNIINNISNNINIKNEISIETSENLCLHSFNFHLLTLISITNLQNSKDQLICQKIYKLIQLYQILINFKDVDPLITTFVNYIKDNILLSFSDASTIQNDALKLFASVDMDKNITNTTTNNNNSLFDKKINNSTAPNKIKNSRNSISSNSSGSTSNSINFDLNAFNLPGDSLFSNDDQQRNSLPKRRKSNASTTSSHLSSNISLASRESSIVSSSRRLSVSSNDSIPSLFPSATSPFQNSNNYVNNNSNILNMSNNISNSNSNLDHLTPTSKMRLIDYSIQPIRTSMNRSRSLSADSRIRSTKMSDRRLSGSNNSIFNNNNNNKNSREGSVEVTSKNSNGDVIMTDDDIVSKILNSDVESEIDSDIILSNPNLHSNPNLNSKSSKSSKRCTNILPTIPSEGNLMKIMGAIDSSNFESITTSINETKDIDFDIGTLFSVNSSSSLMQNITATTNNSNSLSPDSIVLKTKMSDFSKAFKKSNINNNMHNNNDNSISSAFIQNSERKTSSNSNHNISTTTTNSKIRNFNSIHNDQSIIDDDDLKRLREHVMSMKTSIH